MIRCGGADDEEPNSFSQILPAIDSWVSFSVKFAPEF